MTPVNVSRLESMMTPKFLLPDQLLKMAGRILAGLGELIEAFEFSMGVQ